MPKSPKAEPTPDSSPAHLNVKTLGKVEPRSITTEMHESYLDYAMSVIVGRALPDVRDGLKPVHRRILYAMWNIGLRSSAKFRKSATVVGEVLGKYHPHGDVAVYDSMVRMAQDFAMRYPLVDGQGNFGSMDGDNAAAMRYCVTGDTLVVTNSGLQTIKAIGQVLVKDEQQIDIQVLSKDKKIHQANTWFNSGQHPTLKITTDKGYSIQGSYNHPILTLQKAPTGEPVFVWKTLEQIVKGDIAVLDRTDEELWPSQLLSLTFAYPKTLGSRIQEKIVPTHLTRELGFILGCLLAEGSVSSKKIEICNTDKEFLEAFELAWKKSFPDCRLHRFERQPSSFGKKPYTRFEIHSQSVISFFNNLGLTPDKSNKKQIPKTIFESPKDVVAGFLSGYFEGDGSISASRKMVELSCCSVSQQLIAQLQILLLRFGIVSTQRFDFYRKIHKLYIRGGTEYSIFKKEIDFVSQRKRERLAQVIAEQIKCISLTDYIPYLSEYVRKQVPEGTPDRQFVLKHNFDRYQSLEKLHGCVATIVKQEVDPDIQLEPLFQKLLNTHYIFEPIVQIQNAGIQTVYSIKVDSHCHSFIGNGFINHNTEARLTKIADELLSDIDKDTVDFIPNYDGSQEEPSLLPSKIPNLLLNGTVGIAVGMATNIPPHNLTELCNGIAHLIEHPNCDVEDLMEFITGPDFPTGGQIFNITDIRSTYATGKGPIVMRGKAEILEEKNGLFRIVITEIPYQVNKATLIEKIANLVQEKKLEGIRDLRDESDKDGVRVVIELKKDAYPRKVLNRLYTLTQLQETFHVNLLALTHGIQPRVLNLKMALEEFLAHREVVVTRRTKFELQKAEDRAHILEGLVMALEKIDAIISTIKKSKDKVEAKTNLVKKFRLSERQTVAILEMKLQQLANLERLSVEEELKEKRKLIKELKTILSNRKNILAVITQELLELKDKYGDERRTEVVKGAVGKFTQEDLIPKEATMVMLTRDGYIKRIPPDTFQTQKRGGKGVIGLTTKEEDMVDHLFSTNTHADLLFFTSRGRVFQLKAYEIPQASRTAKGQAIVNFLQLAPEEKVSEVLAVGDLKPFKYLMMVTREGTIKKTEVEQFENIRRSGLIALTLHAGDQLTWVKPTSGQDDVILVSDNGQSIRFSESAVRAMGRTAAGVRGLKLKKGGKVTGMDIILEGKSTADEQLLVVMSNGYGKRTALKEYRPQGRGGSGVKTAKITAKTGEVVSAFIVNKKREQEDVIVISVKGQVIRLPLKQISILGRDTQGVRIMKFKEDEDQVASVTFV